MQSIVCPHCHQPINLDDAVKEQLSTHLQHSLKTQEKQLKAELWARAQAEAQKQLGQTQQKHLQELETQLKEQQDRAQAAEKHELELRKQQRAVEERGKQLELELQRQLDQRLHQEIEKANKIEGERFLLKEREYQKQIADMQAAVEEARRKGTTVSQQLQGEVLELELEHMLQEAFPHDQITEVKKGQFGADMLHVVRTPSGKNVGIIVWESKRAEKFTDAWLPKLREDARAAKGSVAVLVTRALPKDITVCAERDHVWITNVEFVVPLAGLLRQTLLRVDQEKLVQAGREVKSEMLYGYINSQEFRGHVEAIVESFCEMKNDLEKEQRALMNSWSKREKQLLRLVTNTAHLYGDLQGVIGSSLPDIRGLALESGS